ncbi:hypothetical protein D3C72_1913140 [compost metagenome]
MANGIFDLAVIGQPHRLGDALHLVFTHHRFGRAVEADDGRQEDRIEGAVVQARVDPAQRMAKAVHAAKPLLEGQCTLQ